MWGRGLIHSLVQSTRCFLRWFPPSSDKTETQFHQVQETDINQRKRSENYKLKHVLQRKRTWFCEGVCRTEDPGLDWGGQRGLPKELRLELQNEG